MLNKNVWGKYISFIYNLVHGSYKEKSILDMSPMMEGHIGTREYCNPKITAWCIALRPVSGHVQV